MRQRGDSAVELMIILVILSLFLLAVSTVYLRCQHHFQNIRNENFVSQQIRIAAASLMVGDTTFIEHWQDDTAKRLPEGQAKIHQAEGLYWLNISWFDRVTKTENSRVYSVMAL